MRHVLFVVFAICILTKLAAQNNQKEIISKSPAALKRESFSLLANLKK
jgi:hypothetical protein